MGAHLAALRRIQDVGLVCHLGYGLSLWEGSVQGDGEGAALLSVLQQHAVVRIMLLELLHLTGKACLWLLLPTIYCHLFFHFLMPLSLKVGDLYVAVTKYLSCWGVVHFCFP